MAAFGKGSRRVEAHVARESPIKTRFAIKARSLARASSVHYDHGAADLSGASNFDEKMRQRRRDMILRDEAMQESGPLLPASHHTGRCGRGAQLSFRQRAARPESARQRRNDVARPNASRLDMVASLDGGSKKTPRPGIEPGSST